MSTLPSGAAQLGIGHRVDVPFTRVKAVENRFGIDLVGTQEERLQRMSQRSRLPKSRNRR